MYTIDGNCGNVVNKRNAASFGTFSVQFPYRPKYNLGTSIKDQRTLEYHWNRKCVRNIFKLNKRTW